MALLNEMKHPRASIYGDCSKDGCSILVGEAAYTIVSSWLGAKPLASDSDTDYAILECDLDGKHVTEKVQISPPRPDVPGTVPTAQRICDRIEASGFHPFDTAWDLANSMLRNSNVCIRKYTLHPITQCAIFEFTDDSQLVVEFNLSKVMARVVGSRVQP